jgi:TetR/AcrR family transcriptional regulator, cholesterol catabolism regulator
LEPRNQPKQTKRRSLKDDRLKQITTIAASLFYKNGYLQTSTRQIAEACGISKGNLYHYIKSKDDLLDLFIETTTGAFDESNKEVLSELSFMSPTLLLNKTIRETLMIIDNIQDTILFWYQESKNMSHEQLVKLFKQEMHIVNLFKIIIEEGCKKGEFTSSDPMVAAYNILMLCDAWAIKRWYFRKNYTLEKYVTHCQQIALNGVGAAEARRPGVNNAAAQAKSK